MIGFIIIAIVIYFVLRIIGFFLSCFIEAWNEIKNAPPELDIEALRKDLQERTEASLWELRNEYHSYLVESINTPYYRFFLDIIGEIDKRIYFLKSQKKGVLN